MGRLVADLIFDDGLLLPDRLENGGVAAGPRRVRLLGHHTKQHLIFGDVVSFRDQHLADGPKARGDNANNPARR